LIINPSPDATLTVNFPLHAAPAPPRAARALSAPLIADDGRLVACSGKDLLAFQRDGSIAWVAPLGHTCNHSISPVLARDKVT
jgi:hypothetical protein